MSTPADIEQKEHLDRQRFTTLVQGWANALERGEDYQVTVAGKPYSIPSQALESGRCRVEYEIDNGEHEFQLTLKWR